MIRALLVVSVAVGLSACGTPCSRVAAAQQNADDKGAGCNSSRNAWTTSKVQSCESNLKNCSENDAKQLELWANCLNALPKCGEGQRTSWEISRASCFLENVPFKVSSSCVSGF
jgi:hypothetical protein